MKFKNALVLTLLVSLMTLSIMIGPAYLEDGPKSDDLLIHIYLNPDAENYALEAGELDINDWPLAKEWIDDWSADANIQLRGYAEIGMMEFDLNNQMWPTGVSLPRTYDPNTDSYKHWYGDSEWDEEAREFRKAIAYLSDKDAYVSNILKGYGYRMDSMIPTPAMAGFIPGDLPTYPYNPTTAAQILDDAGFVLAGGDPDIRNDPKNGGDLAPLEMYVRIDDPNRREAGEMLRDELLAIGIPVNCHITEKSVCFNKAMVEYDYNIYTGGWSLTPEPDFVYWLWSADMYFGGTETSALFGVGWSLNYPGYCNHNFETEAGKILTAVNPVEVREAVFEAQRVSMGDVAIIPLWCSAAQKAYRADWDGVVNEEGFGMDNYWTFLNMEHATDATIDWGFKSNLEGPSVICAEWLWDWNVLGLMYDSLIGLNPFNFALNTGFLAESWSTGLWSTSPDKMYALFTLRDGTLFHDGTTVTPEDVKFSLEFTRDCGPGVAWFFAQASDIDHVDTQAEDGGLGPRDVKVYFTYASYWMLSWSGGIPIINKDLWMAAIGPGTAADYNPATHTFGGSAMDVRDYHPWNADANENDVIDLQEDGTGAWSYVSTETPAAISASTWIRMAAFRDYYMTQTEVTDNLLMWFHAVGDVNEDEVINIVDLALIARALGTDAVGSPHGTGWDEYNVAADLNLDGTIDLFDLYSAGKNFGRVFG